MEPTLAVDVDTPANLERLTDARPGGATGALLDAWGRVRGAAASEFLNQR
jgi:hypothetical protein